MKKNKKMFLSGMFIVLAMLLIISMAIAQDAKTDKPQKPTTEKCMMRQCKMIRGASVYLDSPAVLIGQAEELQLTNDQVKTLKGIQALARKKAMEILTSDQKKKLDRIPAKPITLAELCGEMPCGWDKGTCPLEGAKPRTVKPKACGSGCKKTCCAVKSEPVAEQKTCAVMGGPVNDKSVFIDYKGKKVYFCCPGCIGKFKADPEKYLAKLPQFKE